MVGNVIVRFGSFSIALWIADNAPELRPHALRATKKTGMEKEEGLYYCYIFCFNVLGMTMSLFL